MSSGPVAVIKGQVDLQGSSKIVFLVKSPSTPRLKSMESSFITTLVLLSSALLLIGHGKASVSPSL